MQLCKLIFLLQSCINLKKQKSKSLILEKSAALAFISSPHRSFNSQKQCCYLTCILCHTTRCETSSETLLCDTSGLFCFPHVGNIAGSLFKKSSANPLMLWSNVMQELVFFTIWRPYWRRVAVYFTKLSPTTNSQHKIWSCPVSSSINVLFGWLYMTSVLS